jgi:LysM repeat protein
MSKWILVAVVGLMAFSPAEKKSGIDITRRFIDNTRTIRTLEYKLDKQERIEGKMIRQVTLTRLTKSPFKVYVRQSHPKDGVEVLYVSGQNNNKATVNTNGFPWVNVKLDPMEGMMREDQHHTIFQSGFAHVATILEYICNKYADQLDQMVINKGLVTHDGRSCYAISFENPHFKFIDYTVKQGETLVDIAKRYHLSEYMILERNTNVKSYDDVKAGQVIQIPNDYSPKMLLYVDSERFLPLLMEVYDDKGLYEKYVYSNISVNPDFAPNTFSVDNPAYGF